MSWREQAACKDVDSSVFFPPGIPTDKQYAQAVAYCRACPVADECRAAWACLSLDQRAHGIWAGEGQRPNRLREPQQRGERAWTAQVLDRLSDGEWSPRGEVVADIARTPRERKIVSAAISTLHRKGLLHQERLFNAGYVVRRAS